MRENKIRDFKKFNSIKEPDPKFTLIHTKFAMISPFH